MNRFDLSSFKIYGKIELIECSFQGTRKDHLNEKIYRNNAFNLHHSKHISLIMNI